MLNYDQNRYKEDTNPTTNCVQSAENSPYCPEMPMNNQNCPKKEPKFEKIKKMFVGDHVGRGVEHLGEQCWKLGPDQS